MTNKIKFIKPIKSCTACVAWDITDPSTQPMDFTMHLTRRIQKYSFMFEASPQKAKKSHKENKGLGDCLFYVSFAQILQ